MYLPNFLYRNDIWHDQYKKLIRRLQSFSKNDALNHANYETYLNTPTVILYFNAT